MLCHRAADNDRAQQQRGADQQTVAQAARRRRRPAMDQKIQSHSQGQVHKHDKNRIERSRSQPLDDIARRTQQKAASQEEGQSQNAAQRPDA